MSSNTYDKMPDFIEAIFNVFQFVYKKAQKQQDERLKMISLVILNYVRKMAHDNKIDLKLIIEKETINLIPVFEYISYHNIELYDFSKIDTADVDTTNNNDLERFVLTHIYYITQTI